MEDILPIDWYFQEPIDFEHKQYLLLAYLQKVDAGFLIRKVSPHLLHMSKMVDDMKYYQKNLFKLNRDIYKPSCLFIIESPKIVIIENDFIDEINNIIEFSIPQLTSRINLGYSILKKTQQVLF